MSTLFERNQFSNYSWECMVPRNKLIERWGHSTDVYNGKLYISCGRISTDLDSSDTLCFDPITKEIVKV